MLDINVDENALALDIELTSTLVPLKSMSQSHLLYLLQQAEVKDYFKGQTIFQQGEYDNCHVYLLHGEVEFTDSSGAASRISAHDDNFPLAHHQPRACKAAAYSDCRILKIPSKMLSQLLTWSQIAEYLLVDIAYQRDLDEDVDWMTTVLKSNLFFKVPPINVASIFERLTPALVSAGDVIIRQGEIGDGCYFIKEGEAIVTRASSPVLEPVFLAAIGPGRCFGEDALVNETVRNATVTMKTDGVLMGLEKHDFINLLKEPTVEQVAWPEAMQSANAILIDVRTADEYDRGHAPGAVNLPLNQLRFKARALKQTSECFIYCDEGLRSRAATFLLNNLGFNAKTVEGGMGHVSAPALEKDQSHLLKMGGIIETVNN